MGLFSKMRTFSKSMSKFSTAFKSSCCERNQFIWLCSRLSSAATWLVFGVAVVVVDEASWLVKSTSSLIISFSLVRSSALLNCMLSSRLKRWLEEAEKSRRSISISLSSRVDACSPSRAWPLSGASGERSYCWLETAFAAWLLFSVAGPACADTFGVGPAFGRMVCNLGK